MLRRSRFFDAAVCVTGPRALGLLPWLARLGLVDAGSRGHLEAINAWLLDCNLRLLHGLLRCAPSPPGATAAGTVLAFDQALVVFEQQAVDAYLRRHAVPAAARRDIDRLLAACASRTLSRLCGIDRRLSRAVRHGAGGSFFVLETRIRVGQALVRDLHGAG